MNLYYCVLKNYKGKFKAKEHIGNTHLFLIPISDDAYLYLGMIGELIDEAGTYATQLIIRLPEEIVEQVIEEEINYFDDRYVVLETLPCKVKKLSTGEYDIKLSKKGKMILSNLHIEFAIDYSSDRRRIYLITGEFNFESSDIKSTSDMKMVADKKMAYLGDRTRYESYSIKDGGN
jgi:hypothetical protein